jgi:hypothetical protein
MTDKKIEVKFAPGAFDNFEGTQEEFDEMLTEIHRLVESGDIFTDSRELTEEEFDELPEEVKQQLLDSLENIDHDSETPNKRLLQ